MATKLEMRVRYRKSAAIRHPASETGWLRRVTPVARTRLPFDMPAGFSAPDAGLAFAFPRSHTSENRPRMEPTDVTIEVLKGIRDELRGTNARLDATNVRLERVERRQADTEVRLATELVAVVDAVHEVRDLLRDDRQLRDRVADHERRLTAVETRVGG